MNSGKSVSRLKPQYLMEFNFSLYNYMVVPFIWTRLIVVNFIQKRNLPDSKRVLNFKTERKVLLSRLDFGKLCELFLNLAAPTSLRPVAEGNRRMRFRSPLPNDAGYALKAKLCSARSGENARHTAISWANSGNGRDTQRANTSHRRLLAHLTASPAAPAAQVTVANK